MKIWGQLKKACFEILAVDPAQGVTGRFWFNSASKEVKYDDGVTIQTLFQLGTRGGGNPVWYPQGNAPIDSMDAAFNSVFIFSQSSLQQLFTSIKVPGGYASGRQIKLVLQVYSAENTNSKILMASLATHIRAATDVFNSSANQYSSTTLAAALSATTANKPFEIELDLTDGSGQINGHDVSPNDILQIKLFRQNSATAPQSEVFTDSTQDLNVLVSMEIVF